MRKIIKDIIKSSNTKEDTLNTIEDVLEWIEQFNNTLTVNIVPKKLDIADFWYYDEENGEVLNRNKSFFSIRGVREIENEKVINQQPIIIQDEIGYLGIICREINGILYFLMQAKIEPGNINKIQLSPTIQATKSNFTQKHGGSKPAYVDYFIAASKEAIIVDQIQSEQSSRFYKKRNRNIIIKVDEEIKVLPSHKWLTLGQIKELMKINNLVNMDTRTVLSCIPFSAVVFNEKEEIEIEKYFTDRALFKSIFNKEDRSTLIAIYNYINDYKMFKDIKSEIIPLNQLDNWEIDNLGIRCKESHNFSVIYCNIEVEGREVRNWVQPLFKAEGIATFGLFTGVEDGIRKFLIKCKPEIGCFDKIEIGPTIQLESIEEEDKDEIIKLFIELYNKQQGILYNVILSEEGGRFYHEQNNNIIIDISVDEIEKLPPEYFWVDYKTLNLLTQINNCLNIQLRNLLSLLEI